MLRKGVRIATKGVPPSFPIKYLGIFVPKSDAYEKRYKIKRRITSFSDLLCDEFSSKRCGKRRKSAFLAHFSLAFRWKFIVSQMMTLVMSVIVGVVMVVGGRGKDFFCSKLILQTLICRTSFPRRSSGQILTPAFCKDYTAQNFQNPPST